MQPQEQRQQQSALFPLAVVLLVALVAGSLGGGEARPDGAPEAARTLARPRVIMRRSPLADNHKNMMHNHLSRKVFDRACAASKDSIDEIIACLTNSEILVKTIKEETAKNCYKDSFGADFDPKEVHKHKELICNNREKFETMTTCIYRKTSELMDPKQLDKFTESLVDVGLCIINALDG